MTRCGKWTRHSNGFVFYLFSCFLFCSISETHFVDGIDHAIDDGELNTDGNTYIPKSGIASPVKRIQILTTHTMSSDSVKTSNALWNSTNPELDQTDYFHFNNSPCFVRNRTVDCSRLSMGTIQSFWFPRDAETILFNNNNLKMLPNYTFSHLSNLRRLDLSYNIIDRIELDAFKGLENLRNLSLYQNGINFTGQSQLEYLFYPIRNLKELNLMQNQDLSVGVYTLTFLEQLAKLESLSTDFDLQTLYFGPKFRDMRNLTYVRLAGTFTYINSSSFENIGQVKELHIERLYNIYNVSRDAMKHFDQLKVLTFSHVMLDVQNILPLLEPFEGKNMTEISFDACSSSLVRTDPIKDGYLRGKDTIFLMNICLQAFTLNDCIIYYISTDAVQNLNTWDRCLTHLTFSDNPLYGNNVALLKFARLKSLQKCIFTDTFRSCYELPKFPRQFNQNFLFENMETRLKRSVMKNSMIHLQTQGKHEESKFIVNDKAVFTFSNILHSQTLKTEYYTMSETIEYMNLRRLVGSQTMDVQLVFHGAQNVNYLDLSDSGFYHFLGVIEGLSSLQTLIVSGNDVSVLSTSFFDTLPRLKYLGLSNCRLQRDFMSINSGRLFKNHSKLEQLDLSSNLLNFLSKDSFLHNPSLNYLNLSGNQFRNIPFCLQNTPNLKVLDLRENSITNIDSSTIRELDFLVSRSGNFKLYLEGNVLSCGCNDLKVLEWMRSTLITLDQNGNFTCINKEGERSYTLKYFELDSLWRECWGQVFFYFALILLCLYAIGVFVVFILLKNKHFVMSYFLQTFGGFQLHTRQDYPIGVYIGYSDSDYQFPCNVLRHFIENSIQLNTFINDRDLIASVDKASGIVNDINASWRILLVCSESFLQDDEWSMFTIRSAIYTQSPANPARVVVLVHESCLPLLPPELLSSVNDDNILVVSDWSMNYKLNQMLKTRLA